MDRGARSNGELAPAKGDGVLRYLVLVLVLAVASVPSRAESQSCAELKTIANSEGLAQMQMELRRAGAKLDRLAEVVDRRVDAEIKSAVSAIESSSRALTPLQEAVGSLLPTGTSKLVDASIGILRRTVGASGGVTGLQADTWRLHQASALRSGAEDSRRAAEEVFQRQMQAGREYESRCVKR